MMALLVRPQKSVGAVRGTDTTWAAARRFAAEMS